MQRKYFKIATRSMKHKNVTNGNGLPASRVRSMELDAI